MAIHGLSSTPTRAVLPGLWVPTSSRLVEHQLVAKPLRLPRKSRPNLYRTRPTMVCWACLSATLTQVRLQVPYVVCLPT
jgi:hypothetical protein